MPNWKPAPGDSFEQRCFSGVLIHELVTFIPDIDVACDPPYRKGVTDMRWVSYRKDAPRPTTKEGWEALVGMPLQTML
jgi:hypothetical protein